MDCPNFKKKSQKNSLTKKTAVLALTLTSLLLIFFSPISKSSSLPDCKTFAGSPEPGNNCLFYGLPLCNDVPNAPYNVPLSSIFIGSDNHRVNCADLSDLPLCSQSSLGANPIKDCVKECSDTAFDGGVGIRGSDFAVHNRDCIRFCDAPEAGVVSSPGNNCVSRLCHQLPNGVDPVAGVNCELKMCNLLVPDELDEVIFDDDTKLYCNNNVKCYEFTNAQLPLIKMRENNRTCQIHNCRVSNSCVDNSDDDLQRILNKAALDPTSTFLSLYQDNAYYGYDINSDSLCNRIDCRPTFYRQYLCNVTGFDPSENPYATSPERNCATDPFPATASSECDAELNCPCGFCKKTIDCNLTANHNEPECFQSGSGNAGALPPDDTDSWFYRPKPDNGAVYNGGIIRTMEDSLCYTRNQMEGPNNWGDTPRVLGISLGYFHWDNRSPEMCGKAKLGHRGNGYIYLCGTSGSLYNKPSDKTAFFRGYASSHYIEGGGTHTVNVCLRFNNTMDPQDSCGSRDCMIVCAFSACTQHCGFDKCEELTIDENNPRQCMMNDNHFNGSNQSNCSQVIGGGVDSYLRLRAVKYGNYICGFFDFKGTLAYNPQYLNGSEQLSDGTCLSGDNVDGVCQNSYNTNSQEGVADVWRTVMMVPYIQNNRPIGAVGPRGYLNKAGRIFEEQECPKVPYRIITPRHYNLGNAINSPNMFTPPIYILNARTIRGGSIAAGSTPSNLGETDFHYPEIEVRFGTTTQRLSLGIDYTGYEQTNPDSLASATIITNVDNFDYEAEVFVRKEQVQNVYPIQPTFCLYRKVRDINGAYLEPLRIGCVNRKAADIDNSQDRILNPTLPLRKILATLDPASGFGNPRISFRYLSSNTNFSANSCGDNGVECTAEILLENPDQQTPNCYNDIESRRICAQREECSRLNVECMQNEIAIGSALANNQSIDSMLGIRRNCNEILLPMCNNKKGLPPVVVNNIIDFDYNETPPSNPNLYGWFNEICIISGFEHKLKEVVAHQVSNNKGKCLIDLARSPYELDSDPNTNCDSGGKAPNCLCVEAVGGVIPAQGFEIRQETFREAGLCVDIPIPQTCSAIDYNQSPNPDINDIEYVLSSVNNSVYGLNTGDINGKVHISHRYRSEGKPAPNAIELKGHAEFPTSIFGVDNVVGECKGFWTYQRSAGGNILPPQLNCVNDNGAAVWEDDARNACVRYQCPAIQTSDPDNNGNYQANYGALEVGENKGLSHGFALWNSYLKTNDFLESASASSCITGFKRAGATAQTASGTVTGQNAINASFNNLITGYSGGSLPARTCNQVGQWQAVQNACQRITCPAINPPTPSGPADTAAWTLWQSSGGASFPSVNASRVTADNRVPGESTSIGTCNENLGFYRSPGGQNPTKRCNHLGNWLPTQNACTTRCEDITDDATASFPNNGFSRWSVPNSTKKIRLYQHCPYKGWSAEYEVGNYPNLPGNHHDASSVRVDPGLKVTLYNGANFTGSSVVLTGNLSCFTHYPNLNDRMRSMKVEVNGPETLPAEFEGCVAGYIQNPYPPFLDAYGNPLAPEIANDLTRQAEAPMRVCIVQDSGQGYFTSQWGAVVNACINQCPGSDVDQRIGVGITTHPVSYGSGSINLQWPSTPLGQDAYLSNFTGSANFDASYFSQASAHQFYLVKRRCNADGSWSEPEAMCAANGGQVGNAFYDINAATNGYEDSIPVSLAASINETIAGTCRANYWHSNFNQDAAPTRACLYEDENLRQIDRTYLALVNSTSDCEQRRCPEISGILGSRASIPFVAYNDNRTMQNQRIYGTCLNGQQNSSGQTIYSSPVNGGAYIECLSNGVWSSIMNENNCKLACSHNVRERYWVHYDCNGGGVMDVQPLNMQHDQLLNFTICGCCGGNCGGSMSAYYCDDGNMTVSHLPATGNGGWCSIKKFNKSTRSWESGYEGGIHLNWRGNTNRMYYQQGDGPLINNSTSPTYLDQSGVLRSAPIGIEYWD